MLYGGVKAAFLELDAPEEKKAALRGFVLPTDIHGSRGTWLDQKETKLV